MSQGRSLKRKSNYSIPTEENKRQVESSLNAPEVNPNEPDDCLICHEYFTELEPPYPIGNKCVADPKHKYHSSCLLNFYNSIPVGNRQSRNACMGCGTNRNPGDRNYANNEITNALITDVQNRANIEAQAAATAAAANPVAQAVDPVAQAARRAAAAARHSAEIRFNNDLQDNMNSRIVAEERRAAARRDARLDAEAIEQCGYAGCNIMGGKYRKSYRKKTRKSYRKKSRKSYRKKTRKSYRKKSR